MQVLNSGQLHARQINTLSTELSALFLPSLANPLTINGYGVLSNAFFLEQSPYRFALQAHGLL